MINKFNRQIILLGLVSIAIISSCQLFKTSSKTSLAKKNVTNGTVTTPAPQVVEKPDTSKAKVAKVKPYKDVITAKAITSNGLITIHRIADKYFGEIPDTLLNRDLLIVSRIAKAAADNRPTQGMYGFAGDELNSIVVNFVKGMNDKLYIRRLSFKERSSDSSANGLYRSIANSTLMPIVASFDVKAFGKDNRSTVIDLTDMFNSDNPLLFFDGNSKKKYGLGAFQADRSAVIDCKTFPLNVELATVKTFAKEDIVLTYELNTSIVLLPNSPMKPRFADKRIGFFSQSFIDYDKPKGASVENMILRWRMEPKPEDMEKYLKGELVEPQKPVVYYIDPTTPKKYVPYIIQGVNDWQKAFEKAGFKNAIYALEAPVNDPSFSLLDARHSAIVYKPSFASNASGPNIHDPRSGEILESHINWYHNIITLLHDWYMVQAAPNDPQARKMIFDDQLMGNLARFAVSHEIGHTLGLTHNFGSSATVPTDSLRSKTYLEKYGFCPSIMDYARFNYVAQPQDNIPQHLLMPRIGAYDKWAINWGYRILPRFKNLEEENEYLHKWASQSLRDNSLRFGPQSLILVNDPRNQSEDLGDNAMIAGNYGIENLKVMVKNLENWTVTKHSDYNDLARMYNEVFNQYARYVVHVANNIGQATWTDKRADEGGAQMGIIPPVKQKQAVEFLGKQLFQTPTWLLNQSISTKIGYTSNRLREFQSNIMQGIITPTIYGKMVNAEIHYPGKAYSFNKMLKDLDPFIWTELKTHAPIDYYRRYIQRMYIEQLLEEYSLNGFGPFAKDDNLFKQQTDFFPILLAQMHSIISTLNKAIPKYKPGLTKSHLIDLRTRLEKGVKNGPVKPTELVRPSPQKENTFNSIWSDSLEDAPSVFNLNIY